MNLCTGVLVISLLTAGFLATAGCISEDSSAPNTSGLSMPVQTPVPSLTWNASYWIHIDPQPDRRVYESFPITGNTSAPEGTALHVEVYSGTFCSNLPRIISINRTVIVEKGENGINRWSVFAEAGIFHMDEYFITVYPEDKKDLAVSQLFNVLTPDGHWIHITRVNDFKVGETLSVSGFTDETAGNTIGIEMYRSTSCPPPRECMDRRVDLTGSAAIVATDKGYSSWSFNESLDNFCPDEYILYATSGDVSDCILFNIRNETGGLSV